MAPTVLCECDRSFKIPVDSLRILQCLCSPTFRSLCFVSFNFICCKVHGIDSLKILHSCAFDANWLVVKHGHLSTECSRSSSDLPDFLIVAGYSSFVVGIDTAWHFAITIIPTGKYLKDTWAAHTYPFRAIWRRPTRMPPLNANSPTFDIRCSYKLFTLGFVVAL